MSGSIQGVINESADNIANVLKRSRKIYIGTIEGLARNNIDFLKKGSKGVGKLAKEISYLKDNVYYFIKNLDESSVGAASTFYLDLLGILQDMAQSLEYINKISYTHVLNNHNKLRYNQIRELRDLSRALTELLSDTANIFDQLSLERIGETLEKKDRYLGLFNEKIEKQVAATRSEEVSPKNTNLYFSILTESRELVVSVMKLLELYYSEHDSSVEPVTIDPDKPA